MLVFYYFYMSPYSTLAHIIAKGSTFWSVLLPMLLNYKNIVLMSHQLAAFRSQCQWKYIFVSLTIPMAMETQLGLKRHREGHYSSQCSLKLRYRHYNQWLFLQVGLYHPPPIFESARSAHKRHQGYNFILSSPKFI
jgi:hypothetical protein